MFENFDEGLFKAKYDSAVGIAVFPLSTGTYLSCFGTRMAAGKKVGCHSHRHGDEWYVIINGEGDMYLADVDLKGNVTNRRIIPVIKGSAFVIPENTAHQLVAKTELDLVFLCPNNHLSDDRYIHDLLV